MLTLVAGSKPLAPPLVVVQNSQAAAGTKVSTCLRGHRGFTLLELLVVLAIMAMATAGVTLALRNNGDTALEREAQRLAALFEAARAQSRASGIAVRWHTTPEGFIFEGLPLAGWPTRWLVDGVTVRGTPSVLLGPEPIVGAQAIELIHSQQPLRAIRLATDGLRPFAIQSPEQP